MCWLSTCVLCVPRQPRSRRAARVRASDDECVVHVSRVSEYLSVCLFSACFPYNEKCKFDDGPEGKRWGPCTTRELNLRRESQGLPPVACYENLGKSCVNTQRQSFTLLWLTLWLLGLEMIMQAFWLFMDVLGWGTTELCKLMFGPDFAESERYSARVEALSALHKEALEKENKADLVSFYVQLSALFIEKNVTCVYEVVFSSSSWWWFSRTMTLLAGVLVNFQLLELPRIVLAMNGFRRLGWPVAKHFGHWQKLRRWL